MVRQIGGWRDRWADVWTDEVNRRRPGDVLRPRRNSVRPADLLVSHAYELSTSEGDP